MTQRIRGVKSGFSGSFCVAIISAVVLIDFLFFLSPHVLPALLRLAPRVHEASAGNRVPRCKRILPAPLFSDRPLDRLWVRAPLQDDKSNTEDNERLLDDSLDQFIYMVQGCGSTGTLAAPAQLGLVLLAAVVIRQSTLTHRHPGL